MALPDKNKQRIGDLLLDNHMISESSLSLALEEQNITGGRLGTILTHLGLVSEDDLLVTLANQLKIPVADLSMNQYNRSAICSLSETIARRNRVVVLEKNSESVVLAMADPTDIFCIDEVAKSLSLRVDPVIAKESEIVDLINASYSGEMKIASLVQEVNQEISNDILNIDAIVNAAHADEAPVARLLLKIFEEAIRFTASDIHIEPDEGVLRIRQRVNGVLSEQVLSESRVVMPLVIKLKLMAGLDITEKRLPQDGRFTITVHYKKVDVRLSTMPIQYGESVVMRLLLLDEGVKSLDHIGMNELTLNGFRNLIQKPNGLVLVTGPTGSGKTTSLYAAIAELNHQDTKIITVEDPIEYRLPRVNQVQVNDKIGLDFTSILRSALRQDPNIILIGEIRDQESAQIALRSAMTGHLVFSTLHTNDAPSAAIRLVDMGVQPYMIASALSGIVAQRLLRCLCEQCKERMADDASVNYEWLSEDFRELKYYQSRGCEHCHYTGYTGRIGVFEFLIINDEMRSALRQGELNQFMALASRSELYTPLLNAALSVANRGITSLDEVKKMVV